MSTQASSEATDLPLIQPGEVLCQDIYPAEFLTPEGELLRDVRVFATSHRVLVYGESADRRVELVRSTDLKEVGSIPADTSTLRGQLEVGARSGTGWVNLGHGCGCGSPLKAMAPPVPRTYR